MASVNSSATLACRLGRPAVADVVKGSTIIFDKSWRRESWPAAKLRMGLAKRVRFNSSRTASWNRERLCLSWRIGLPAIKKGCNRFLAGQMVRTGVRACSLLLLLMVDDRA